jgi:hypothetical protein
MDALTQNFPQIQLPFYERINHLGNHLSLFIPKGPKYFAWFTYLENKPICIFLHNDHNQIQTAIHHYASFKEELSLGTILYGTLIDQHFVCENLFYFKGKHVQGNYTEKLSQLKDVLNMTRNSDFNGSVSFHLPYMTQQKVLLECSNMPYAVYGILQLQSKPRLYVLQPTICTFRAKKREETEDVYELMAYNENKELSFYSTALINDFKTSHFMKKLFYKNKTTYRTSEFSDSEEEYEGDVHVGCIFVPEFRRWKPFIKGERVDSIQQIQFNEKKIYGYNINVRRISAI